VAELCVGHKLRGLHAVYDRYSYVRERAEAYDRYAKHILAVVDGTWVDPWRDGTAEPAKQVAE
jgi:hypothetical protein